jgi:hypothetical protein
VLNVQRLQQADVAFETCCGYNPFVQHIIGWVLCNRVEEDDCVSWDTRVDTHGFYLLLSQHKAAAEAEAARAAAEAEENQRRLKEEEARAAEEQQRARMQQCDKEVDEIKVRL